MTADTPLPALTGTSSRATAASFRCAPHSTRQPRSEQQPTHPFHSLQAFLAGWGGLRVTRTGLRLLPPALPLSVGALTLRNLSWRTSTLTLRITAGVAALSVSAGAPLCLVDAAGVAEPVLTGGPPVTLANATFAWPGLLVGVGEQGACQ